MNLVVLGFGYSIRHSLPWLRPIFNDSITGTTRQPGKAARMASRGVELFLLSGAGPDPIIAKAISQASHILVGAGPGPTGDPFLRPYAEALKTAAGRSLGWIGYLSTIGVYGDTAGGWVDETTPATSTSPRGIERRKVEDGWEAIGRAAGIPVALFRLGGIYGPGRNAFVNLSRGTARRILREGQVFNRIHVGDIGQVVAAAAAQTAGGVFNVTDGDPTPAEDPILYAADLMQVPPPPEVPFEAAAFSPMARSFWEENRRVSNARLSRDLGVTLDYPTYREGLGALWRGGTWAGDDEDREEASPRFRSG